MRDREYLEKFGGKSDEGTFLGYSKKKKKKSQAYRVFNHTTMMAMESIHVVIDKTNQVGEKLNKEEEIETPIEQYTPIQVLPL